MDLELRKQLGAVIQHKVSSEKKKMSFENVSVWWDGLGERKKPERHS